MSGLCVAEDRKFENELTIGVPSDKIFCISFFSNPKSWDSCKTPPGGAGQASTCNFIKLLYAQIYFTTETS